MHEMLSVAKRIGISEDIVRYSFLRALSSTISPVIASEKDLNPSLLGKLAEELVGDVARCVGCIKQNFESCVFLANNLSSKKQNKT